MKSILCGKLEDIDEFKVQCIINQCPYCGDLSKFPLQNENIDELTLVSWMRYEYETYQNKKGVESKKNYIEGDWIAVWWVYEQVSFIDISMYPTLSWCTIAS